MPETTLSERACRYILERQCQSGGFCFYRLEEPNGADTFYALATLHLLGRKIKSIPTRRFLLESQHEDGSFDNIYQASYTIRGLHFMGSRPRKDPRDYVAGQLAVFPVEHATLETQLKRLDILTRLCEDLHVKIPSRKRETMIDFILSYANEDGGFGAPYSSLLVTHYAVACLAALAFSLPSLEIKRFLQTCEHPVHGFLNVPDMAPSFLEHILGGISASRAVGYVPRYLEVCRRFVSHCQSTNGGFARSPGGLPSLHDTYRAILALVTIDALAKTR